MGACTVSSSMYDVRWHQVRCSWRWVECGVEWSTRVELLWRVCWVFDQETKHRYASFYRFAMNYIFPTASFLWIVSGGLSVVSFCQSHISYYTCQYENEVKCGQRYPAWRNRIRNNRGRKTVHTRIRYKHMACLRVVFVSLALSCTLSITLPSPPPRTYLFITRSQDREQNIQSRYSAFCQ